MNCFRVKTAATKVKRACIKREGLNQKPRFLVIERHRRGRKHLVALGACPGLRAPIKISTGVIARSRALSAAGGEVSRNQRRFPKQQKLGGSDLQLTRRYWF
jgi:hypothetical protein